MIVGYDRPLQRHPVRFSSSSKGSGGRAHHPSSSVFCGLPRIPPLLMDAGFCAPANFAIPPFVQGFPTIFRGPAHFRSFRASPPIFEVMPTFGVLPNFSRSGCHPRSGCLPRSGCHPRSIRHPRSFRHLTPGLSVTRPPVCPSPALWSVRHLTLVCPPPSFGLSVTRPRSVCHPTLVCPSPDLTSGRFRA